MSDAAEREDNVESEEWRPADRARIVLWLILGVVGVVYLVAALQLPMEQRERPGAGVFPVVAVTIFLICVVTDLGRFAIAGRRGRWERGSGRVAGRVLMILVMLVAYVVLVGVVGHLVITAAIAAGLTIVFGRRPWWQVAIVAVVAGLGTDYLFSELLGVRLETGLMGIGAAEWI